MPLAEGGHGTDQNQLAAGTLRHPGVSIKEAAWHFSVHRRTVARWIREGKIKFTRLPSGRARIILEVAR